MFKPKIDLAVFGNIQNFLKLGFYVFEIIFFSFTIVFTNKICPVCKKAIKIISFCSPFYETFPCYSSWTLIGVHLTTIIIPLLLKKSMTMYLERSGIFSFYCTTIIPIEMWSSTRKKCVARYLSFRTNFDEF